MEKLKQNTLNDSTTELGFVHVINDNIDNSSDKIAFQREITLEDGTVVTVESVTPETMKRILKNNAVITGSSDDIKFITPGEITQVYTNPDKVEPTETTLLKGIVQIANNSEIGPEPTPAPDAEEVMNILNEIDGTSDSYDGMGGTEEEIEAIFDEILGN